MAIPVITRKCTLNGIKPKSMAPFWRFRNYLLKVMPSAHSCPEATPAQFFVKVIVVGDNKELMQPSCLHAGSRAVSK